MRLLIEEEGIVFIVKDYVENELELDIKTISFDSLYKRVEVELKLEDIEPREPPF